MKVRWTAKSVRLRITPSELEALLRDEPVKEVLSLGDATALTATIIPGGPGTDLQIEGGGLLLYLCAADLRKLSEPDEEGVYFTYEGSSTLRYMVEKDFPCVHPRASESGEPPGETFRPPDGFEQRET